MAKRGAKPKLGDREPVVSLTVTIPKRWRAWIRMLAEQRGMSMTTWIKQAMLSYQNYELSNLNKEYYKKNIMSAAESFFFDPNFNTQADDFEG